VVVVTTAGHAVAITFSLRQSDNGFDCSFQPLSPPARAGPAGAAPAAPAAAPAAAAAKQNCTVYTPLPAAVAAVAPAGAAAGAAGLLAVSVGDRTTQSVVGGAGGVVAVHGDEGWAVGGARDGDVVR
jgi:hypothetical protein